MPPCAFTHLKYASAPRATPPAADASPVNGAVPPSVIVVAVTPGVARGAAPAAPAATTTATATMMTRRTPRRRFRRRRSGRRALPGVRLKRPVDTIEINATAAG